MEAYIPKIIATAIVLVLIPVIKVAVTKLVRSYGRKNSRSELRTAHMIRVVKMLLNTSEILLLAIIWGVKPENILITLSSIFAVIGVAMFAQWSILSNITSGIIIFFNTPFRIGDEINIMDKDLPIVASIENIYTFHIHLRTREGELIIIPNSLFLQKIVSMHD